MEIATRLKSTGNAADVHGLFLHRNGRLYWCHGCKGHEFYQNGDVFGAANIFQGMPRNDAALHWVHGGVYPRTDHVAPAGIVLPRADTWGDTFRDNLFFAEFNTRRITSSDSRGRE